MRGLELNLATRPFRNNTLIWVGYAVLFSAAIGFSYWNVSSYRDYKAELARLDARDGNIEQQQLDLKNRHRQVLKGVGAFDVKAIGRRTTKANEVIQWRAFSWTRLFNRLEDMLPAKVRMTSVRPIFRERDRYSDPDDTRQSVSVNVEGLARDWDSFFEIQTRLIEHESFGHVNPRSVEKGTNGEFTFNIDFAYYAEEAADEQPDDSDVEAATPEPSAETASAEPGRSLPPSDPPVGEVTDDWAEKSGAQKQDEAPPAKTTRKRGPQRRALPQVQPETEDSDDQGGPR